MTQIFLTIAFVVSLSFLTLAASFADVPPQTLVVLPTH
jgi:hypothetical protein